MQKLELELDEMNFHCPATGKRVLCKDEATEPSPATKFVFMHEVGIMDCAAPGIEELYDEVCEAVEDSEDDAMASQYPYEVFLEKLGEAKERESWVVFSITTCGFACGPVSSTVDVCIDMNYLEETQD